MSHRTFAHGANPADTQGLASARDGLDGALSDWHRPHACGEVLPPDRRVAMISYHTCPLAAPGGKQTGGMNVYVRELMRQLGRRGYRVDAFTRSESEAVPHVADSDLGPHVRVVHVKAGPEAPLGKNAMWQAIPEFVEGVLEHMRADGEGYDILHSHYWMSGWAALRIAEVFPAPIIQMFHTLGVMKDLAGSEFGTPEIEPRRGVERDLMSAADMLVAATPVDAQHMIDYYGADPARIEVIPPGVDVDLFHPMPREAALQRIGHDPCEQMILFVGRMDPIKGLETLLRALAIGVARDPELMENACLAVVGGDTLDDPAIMDAEMVRMDKLRRELGLGDFVKFVGALGQDVLPSWYNAAEVVIVPSRYESFGMVALEAMACGTPVIASDVGGLSTLVHDGRTGFLVADRDPEALAAKLLPLLALPEIHDTLGEHGVATAEAYGWPYIAQRVDDLYDRLLQRAGCGVAAPDEGDSASQRRSRVV